MRNSYVSIQNFGNIPQRSDINDPLTYCMTDTMDKNFIHAPNGQQYGPRSRKCQLFMAERCADKWDGYCEYFYREHGLGGVWPNNQEWPNTLSHTPSLSFPNLSSGDQLLQNTAELRYCKYTNCIQHCEPFDPMNPYSKKIKWFSNPQGGDCTPICRVDPKTIDQDPVMDRLLVNPKAGATTLVNICNTARRDGTDLSGTKIGKLCENYFQVIRK